MSKAFIFNASAEEIEVSINNGDYFSVPPANPTSWAPSVPETSKWPDFVNQSNPGRGQIGITKNQITMYPATSGPISSVNFTLELPRNVKVSSLQIYLFWKDADNVAWAALNGGQLICSSDLQHS